MCDLLVEAGVIGAGDVSAPCGILSSNAFCFWLAVLYQKSRYGKAKVAL